MNLPPLPERYRSMFCTKCGYCNNETKATENAPCENSNCQYFAFVSERDYTAEQMQEYAREALAAAKAEDAEDARHWREHMAKLDSLVTYCPTCCEGFAALPDMTHDQLIFECGKAAGKGQARREAEAERKSVVEAA